ncbi:MAG: DTW domain-containing protein [Myxococcaceae bacterium]|nr:DTW domain-containing protein [Myxococcaceae bacterium]MCI0670335.1 DTW domain-containing protein [Myxococcaceae bacterium]
MGAKLPPDMAGKCVRCFLPEALCVCAEVPRVETRTRVLLVRHVMETWKASNTARLAAMALPGAELVAYGDRERSFERHLPLPEGSWLLWPEGPPPPPDAPPPRTVVVLDGSWSQARRMMQRHPAFRALPRLVLAPPTGALRLRIPPREDGMSTLEAVALALAQLEGPGVAEPLLTLHELFTRRGLQSRGRRSQIVSADG